MLLLQGPGLDCMSMRDWAARMGTLLARLPSKRVGAGAAAAGKRLDVKARQESAWDCRAATLLSTTQSSEVRAPPALPFMLWRTSWVLGSGLWRMGLPHGRPAVEHPVIAGTPPSLQYPSNAVLHVVALGLRVECMGLLLMLCCTPRVLLSTRICHMPGNPRAPWPASRVCRSVSCSLFPVRECLRDMRGSLAAL